MDSETELYFEGLGTPSRSLACVKSGAIAAKPREGALFTASDNRYYVN
jgi:hypothetical protein